MNQLTILPDQKIIQSDDDKSMLDMSLEAGVAHAHACGGSGRCSSCRVIITDGLEYCSPRTEQEEVLANQLAFRPHIRLACQTKISGPVVARRPILDEVDMELIGNEFDKSHQSLGEEKIVTLLFADIEGYTSMTEKALPYDIVHMLNRYYYHMGKVIQEHKGRIMDYFGDGFLAIFGLEDSTDHAYDAINAGYGMQKQMEKLNPNYRNLFGRDLNVRIGINTGSAIVGSIGIKGMQKLAAIGDSVNLASRIEDGNKRLNTTFLISASTHELTKDKIVVKSSHELELKGKSGVFKVFEI